MTEFGAGFRREGDRAIVTIAGEFDLPHLSVVEALLIGALEDGATDIVVDCAAVTFVDATARRLLARYSLLWPFDSVRLTVVNVPANLAQWFKQVGLTRLVDVR
jgi:anti-anti-sigma factor